MKTNAIKRLEAELEEARQNEDQYNKVKNSTNVQRRYYEEGVHNDTLFRPTNGERLKTYTDRIGNHAMYIEDISTQAHIKAPNGAWPTHRRAGACFMCDQINLVNHILHAFRALATLAPDYKFVLNAQSNTYDLEIHKEK